ncbi:MAG: DUF3500 domain-containing protein [Steroidobacteraceae bacterium]
MTCAAEALYNTLTTAQQSTIQLLWSNDVAKTEWSNLPGKTRAGLEVSAMTNSSSRTAMLALAQVALSDQGYDDYIGVLAADDYLGTIQSSYGSGNYYVGFIGTPSSTGDWMLMLGGHHMAFNITFLSGVAYPTPHHIGVEPKASFTVTGDYAGTYQVLADKAAALVAMYNGLTDTELSSAYISGTTFSDVVLGPVEYGTGTYSAVSFPTGSSRKGILVSSLTSAQQALVTAAIKQYVEDYPSDVSDSLLSTYTSSSAYADTYISWGGTQSAGVAVDTANTYMRIDGPRVWIEVACQQGVVITSKTHYHMIYRDKSYDYGNQLSD